MQHSENVCFSFILHTIWRIKYKQFVKDMLKVYFKNGH